MRRDDPETGHHVAKKALGVWNPDKKHVEQIKVKGLSWVSKAGNTGYVTTADNWRSIMSQLRPKLSYVWNCERVRASDIP